jgi:hypothetical protein
MSGLPVPSMLTNGMIAATDPPPSCSPAAPNSLLPQRGFAGRHHGSVLAWHPYSLARLSHRRLAPSSIFRRMSARSLSDGMCTACGR